MVAEDTRTRIMSVALELFVKQGYEPTSLREIADRVGITKASLYYHFASKQALLGAVVEPLVEDWRAWSKEVSSSASTPENVREALRRYLEMTLAHRAVATLLIHDAAAAVVVVAPMFEEAIQIIRRVQTWIAGPGATGRDRILAQAALDVVAVALSSGGILLDATDEELRETLLEAATSVLGI